MYINYSARFLGYHVYNERQEIYTPLMLCPVMSILSDLSGVINLPIFFRVTSITLGQCDCPSASEVTLKNMGKSADARSQPNTTLRWRHNGCDSVSNHQPREWLLRRLITRTSKKTSKLRVIGLCAGNSPETGEFPAQMASNAENVSIWWRHHEKTWII